MTPSQYLTHVLGPFAAMALFVVVLNVALALVGGA